MTTDRRKLEQTWCIEAQHSVGMIPEEEKRQNTLEARAKASVYKWPFVGRNIQLQACLIAWKTVVGVKHA